MDTVEVKIHFGTLSKGKDAGKTVYIIGVVLPALPGQNGPYRSYYAFQTPMLYPTVDDARTAAVELLRALEIVGYDVTYTEVK